MTDRAATAADVGSGARQATQQKGPRDRSHPVRLYVERVASQDIEDYPEWDLAVRRRRSVSHARTGATTTEQLDGTTGSSRLNIDSLQFPPPSPPLSLSCKYYPHRPCCTTLFLHPFPSV